MFDHAWMYTVTYQLFWPIQEDGRLVIGAPGSYLWRGVGFVYDGINEALPVSPRPPNSDSYGYDGMGVTQARITSSTNLGMYVVCYMRVAVESMSTDAN